CELGFPTFKISNPKNISSITYNMRAAQHHLKKMVLDDQQRNLRKIPFRIGTLIMLPSRTW
ncbi:MAG: hypothetical protein JXR90_00985, partial [Spirochaetes bacterium]|nr:hypothetical protein [Spirochaetota bacterium]